MLSRAWIVAFILHVTVLLALVWSRPQPVRIGAGVEAGRQSIGAFVIPAPRPVGTAGTSAPRAKSVRPSDAIRREPAPITEKAHSGEGQAIAAAPAGAGQEQSIGTPTGPVRLSPGQHLGLIKKVEPVYPATLDVAGIEGTVVLDAVVRRDGTVGDITVVRSTNSAFEQPAIDAVKQWRYTPLPYDGLLTVTINFTLRRR